MKKCLIKRSLSITIAIIFILQCFALPTFAVAEDEIFVYIGPNGKRIEYMIDNDGNKYIYENNERVYIAIPVRTEYNVTIDVCSPMSATASIDAKSIPYSKTMNVGNTDVTDIIDVEIYDYVYLECSQYRPLFADKGVSYFMNFSNDGVNWVSQFYVNENLNIPLRHLTYDGGYSYMTIRMWTYNGDLETCLLEVTDRIW